MKKYSNFDESRIMRTFLCATLYSNMRTEKTISSGYDKNVSKGSHTSHCLDPNDKSSGMEFHNRRHGILSEANKHYCLSLLLHSFVKREYYIKGYFIYYEINNKEVNKNIGDKTNVYFALKGNVRLKYQRYTYMWWLTCVLYRWHFELQTLADW